MLRDIEEHYRNTDYTSCMQKKSITYIVCLTFVSLVHAICSMATQAALSQNNLKSEHDQSSRSCTGRGILCLSNR